MPVTAGIAVAIAGVTGTTVTTASFTPAVGSLLIALTTCRNVGAMPTISDSLGGTWTGFTAGESATAVKSKLWWHVVTTAAARTVTMVSTGAAQVAIGIVAVSGGDNTNFTNFATVYNAAGDPSLTLAAFQPNAIGLGFMTGNAGGTATSTPPVGYTEIYDAQPATNLRISIVKDESSPGTTLAWVSTATDSHAYGLEIREAAVVGGGSALKVWDSAWTEKPVKVWDGSAWVAKPVKIWNGSAWV